MKKNQCSTAKNQLWYNATTYYRFEKTNVSGENRYTLLVSTESVRADKVFFRVQFDSPVRDIIFEGSGNLTRTRVPQVVGIFDEDFRLGISSGNPDIRFMILSPLILSYI